MKKLIRHFTLIELMIVVAIIATITVPQLLDARRNANEKACIGTLRSFITDQETYLNDNPNAYATIPEMNADKKINLTIPKAGYTFGDLIITPTAAAFAV